YQSAGRRRWAKIGGSRGRPIGQHGCDLRARIAICQPDAAGISVLAARGSLVVEADGCGSPPDSALGHASVYQAPTSDLATPRKLLVRQRRDPGESSRRAILQ